MPFPLYYLIGPGLLSTVPEAVHKQTKSSKNNKDHSLFLTEEKQRRPSAFVGSTTHQQVSNIFKLEHYVICY
jgi:hypothetical protein